MVWLHRGDACAAPAPVCALVIPAWIGLRRVEVDAVTSRDRSLLGEVVRLLPRDDDDDRICDLDPAVTAQAIREAVSRVDPLSARAAAPDWETAIRLCLELAAHVGFAVGEGHWNDGLILRIDDMCDAVGEGEEARSLQGKIAEELDRLERSAPRMVRYRPKSVYAERPRYFYDARDAACWLAALLAGLRFADRNESEPVA